MTNLSEAFNLELENDFSIFANDIAFDCIRIKKNNYLEKVNNENDEQITKTDIKTLKEKVNELKGEILDIFTECSILESKLESLKKIYDDVDNLQKTIISANNSIDDFDVPCEELYNISEKCKKYLDETKEKYSKKRVIFTKLLQTSSYCCSLDNVRLCPICIHNEVNYAFSPCGHTFCEKCLSKNTSNTCYICRLEGKTLKLFFS